MIISRTPYRISFLGGGTDYPQWYQKHGGAVLATTIDKYCYLNCRYLPPFFEHKYRLVYSAIESCREIDDIRHPSAREIIRYMKLTKGLEIHHDGDLPARSGMGSSSSFTVGLLHALYALKGQMLSKHDLAMQSIEIEQDILKEVVGSQDQVLAAYGGLNHVTFDSNGKISCRPVTITRARQLELSAHLMLFYTGIKRTAANVAGSYVSDLDNRRRQMRIMKDLVDEGLNVLTSGTNIREFGELLHEVWLTKSSLSEKVTNPKVDSLYETARSAGAIGGKLTGAGGGGFMLLFVPPAKQPAVSKALNKLINVPFRFEYDGSQIIFYDMEQDYSANSLLRDVKPPVFFEELAPDEDEVWT